MDQNQDGKPLTTYQSLKKTKKNTWVSSNYLSILVIFDPLTPQFWAPRSAVQRWQETDEDFGPKAVSGLRAVWVPERWLAVRNAQDIGVSINGGRTKRYGWLVENPMKMI